MFIFLQEAIFFRLLQWFPPFLDLLISDASTLTAVSKKRKVPARRDRNGKLRAAADSGQREQMWAAECARNDQDGSEAGHEGESFIILRWRNLRNYQA